VTLKVRPDTLSRNVFFLRLRDPWS
jgi:hypothetical protein